MSIARTPLRRFLFGSLACLCLALLPFAAPAAIFCVDSVTNLRTALETAEDNRQDDPACMARVGAFSRFT